MGGGTWGGQGPTTLVLRDAEGRVPPVQNGALRAHAALAQHVALLCVQWAQDPILARFRGFTSCHTGLVGRVTGAQEGCRGIMDIRPSPVPRAGILPWAASVGRGEEEQSIRPAQLSARVWTLKALELLPLGQES